MKILSIDTSCDETAVAVVDGRRVLSNELYSQIAMHTKWGGVMPQLARRAHEEYIDKVVEKALSKSGLTSQELDAVAVTYGPGLAIALGVGIDAAKKYAALWNKPLIKVNHMEGHIYSCFVQNSAGNPERPMTFPYLVLLASGSHSELVLFKDHVTYEVLGETVDDAAGEALDKAARMIVDEVMYPGGPVIEQLALTGDENYVKFPRPMLHSKDMNFSFSGLKTSLLNYLKKIGDAERVKHMNDIAASFQTAVFDSLIGKLEKAMDQYGVTNVALGGGVSANALLRKRIRAVVKAHGGTAYFPTSKKLYGDNAAMIGVAAHYHGMRGDFVKAEDIEREARAGL